MQEIAIIARNDDELAAAQATGASHDGIEDRLHVSWRAANDPEDLAGRGLLVECSRQVTIAGLQFREQPHILDCDDRLVGEGLEKGDLPVREELSLGAAEVDHADRDTFTYQGNRENRAELQPPSGLAGLGILVDLGLHVIDVDRSPVEDGPSRDGPREWYGRLLPDRPVMGGAKKPVSVPSPDRYIKRLTQASGALR